MVDSATGLEGQVSGEGGIRAADAAVADETLGIDVTGGSGAPLDGLTALDRETGEVLTQVARAMYPHDRVPDLHYERVVAALDVKAAADPALKTLLTGGVGYLATTTGRYPRDFGGLADADKVAALTRIQHTPFFKAIAGEVVVNLYSQHDIWSYFGYEGPAPNGYPDTFDDIDWLDDAPDHRGKELVDVLHDARGDEQTVAETNAKED